jgi:hypothetical protein
MHAVTEPERPDAVLRDAVVRRVELRVIGNRHPRRQCGDTGQRLMNRRRAVGRLGPTDARRADAMCRQALQHLPLEHLGRPVRMKIREVGQDGRKNGGDRSRCSSPDETARTVVAKADRKGGQILIATNGHPPAAIDGLAPTIRGGGSGHSAPQVVMAVGAADGRGTEARHPASVADAPSMTIKANSGRQGSGAAVALTELLDNPNQPARSADEAFATITVAGRGHTARLEWPWDRPSTTVYEDERLAPPGRRPAEGIGSVMSSPNAIVLSERAAAILQGFPDGWLFAGATKKARWSQIGMAMPPRREGRRSVIALGSTGLLFRDSRLWHQVKRCDVRARELADRHYSRQTPGAAEFMANGRTLVLLTLDARAVWGVIENNDPHGGRHWRCAIFRNEGTTLSSRLVEEATAETIKHWRRKYHALPPVALTTEIDPTQTRPKLHPGRCFREAGWTVVEVSNRSNRHKELVILRAPMERYA